MSNIPRISLEDSLYVLQLARETALAQNRQAQAKRMMPVVEEMRSLVANPSQPSAIPPSSGVMGQSDFKTLLSVTQSRVNQTQTVDSAASIMDRNRLIGAMAEANMSDVDIARQFSITREEVQLVLNVQQKNKSYGDKLR
jgi:cell pole-organizing protein PopZ